MAYQNIKRAKISTQFVDPRTINENNIPDALNRIQRDYQQLAQEVVLCHNNIQEFPVAIANGLTTIAVTFPAPTLTAGYTISLNPEFDAGSFWTTVKTTTGFTANWKTAAVGAQTLRVLIVE